MVSNIARPGELGAARTCARGMLGLLLSVLMLPVAAYDGKLHQQLTFIAARQFNDCAHQYPHVTRFSALDTRYIVRANVSQADSSVFVRMFRWNYYNRADQTNRSSLGLIDTRFHKHFESVVDDTRWSVDRQKRLKNLGRILNYIQDMTAPARVVPVYTGRWWRLSLGDRFERYPLQPEQVTAAVEDMCEEILSTSASFQEVLQDTASRTLSAVQAPIFGVPATWEAYWQLARDPEDFGEYGPAGNNFGDRTGFRCGDGERCLLLKDDPLYQDFATARHIDAVVATLRAMALMQLAEAERVDQTTAR